MINYHCFKRSFNCELILDLKLFYIVYLLCKKHNKLTVGSAMFYVTSISQIQYLYVYLHNDYFRSQLNDRLNTYSYAI